jgi:hypothetical protein
MTSVKGLFRAWEAAVGHLCHVLAHGGADLSVSARKFLVNSGCSPSDAKGIVHDQDLAIGALPAPMPMTGMRSALVMRSASAAGTHSSTSSWMRPPAAPARCGRSPRPDQIAP